MFKPFLSRGLAAAALTAALAAAPALSGMALAQAGNEPRDLTVTSYPSATSASLSWQMDPRVIQGFDVYRRVAGAPTWTYVKWLTEADTRSYVDTGLSPATLYEYRVVSWVTGGSSSGNPSVTVPFATPSSAAVAADYAAAAAPRRVDAQPLNASTVVVTWQDATPDETGFQIERRAGSGSWGVLASVGANVTLYRDTLASASTAYQYRVTALRAVGASAPSVVANAKTPSTTTPSIFFVDAVSGRDWKPGTEAEPWQTIAKAAQVMAPGQTVLVRNGTYTGAYAAIVTIDKSGSATGGYITYKSYPGERPKLRSTKGKNYSGFSVLNAAYIVIDGFEIEGHLKEVTQAEAQADFDNHKNNGVAPGPVTSSSGISVEGRNASKPLPHHVVIRNNRIYDHPLAGIAAMTADYLTIENNRVDNVGRLSSYGGSGISILQAKDLDSNTSTYKLVIQGNVVSRASNEFACGCYSFRQPTDGNGIILDTFNTPISHNYRGRTLVQNNLVYDNGGRGIHAFVSNNVDVFYNTTYQNSTIAVTGEGEITAINSRNVRVHNNIMVARPDRPLVSIRFASAADKTAYGATVVFEYNILNGGRAPDPESSTVGVIARYNRINTDPRFVSVSGPYAFQLRADSPAVNTRRSGVTVPLTDAYGAPRGRGGVSDVGAVESF